MRIIKFAGIYCAHHKMWHTKCIYLHRLFGRIEDATDF